VCKGYGKRRSQMYRPRDDDVGLHFNQHDEANRPGSSAISANQSVKALIAPFAAQWP